MGLSLQQAGALLYDRSFELIQVDLDVIHLRAQFIEPFESSFHESCREVMSKVVEAHAYKSIGIRR